MNAQNEYFVYLLSCFLNGTKPEGRDCDFYELYRLADIHDVGAIIAQELKALPDIYRPTGNVRSCFNQVIGRTIQDYEKKTAAYNSINKLLLKEETDHLFVKGILVRQYYPVKEFRTSGDIDVLVRPDALEKIKEICEARQIPIVNYVSDTLTVCLYGADIELHCDADVMTDYFDDVFAVAETEKGCRYSFGQYDHLLYVLCHLAKHLAYRGAGVRMLMDMDVMIRAFAPFDENAFLALCDKAGIRKTAEVVLSLCRLWFQTPVTALVDFAENTALLERLETVFLDGGSFGYVASAVPAKYYTDAEKQNRFLVLMKMAFPGKEYLKTAYPYYRKHSVLYPMARLNRLFDALFIKRKIAVNALKQIQSDQSPGMQLALLQELGIQPITE